MDSDKQTLVSSYNDELERLQAYNKNLLTERANLKRRVKMLEEEVGRLMNLTFEEERLRVALRQIVERTRQTHDYQGSAERAHHIARRALK